MTESTPPSLPSPANTKLWWFVWILCTVIFPGGTLGLLAVLPGSLEWVWIASGIGCLVFHLIASVKLGKGRSGWLTAGLIFGGWALMLVSVFIGCIALMTQSQNH